MTSRPCRNEASVRAWQFRHNAISRSRSKSEPPWARLMTWCTSSRVRRPHAWQTQRARARTCARMSRYCSRLAEGRPSANRPPARMRRREARPMRIRFFSRRERIRPALSFAHMGEDAFLTLASPRVHFPGSPTWANARVALDGDTLARVGRLELPLWEALPAPGQEDGHGVR